MVGFIEADFILGYTEDHILTSLNTALGKKGIEESNVQFVWPLLLLHPLTKLPYSEANKRFLWI